MNHELNHELTKHDLEINFPNAIIHERNLKRSVFFLVVDRTISFHIDVMKGEPTTICIFYEGGFVLEEDVEGDIIEYLKTKKKEYVTTAQEGHT